VSAGADAIHAWLLTADEERAYRELIQINDDLASEDDVIRVALSAAPPALVGDPRFDAPHGPRSRPAALIVLGSLTDMPIRALPP
jgi:hypothetical protein